MSVISIGEVGGNNSTTTPLSDVDPAISNSNQQHFSMHHNSTNLTSNCHNNSTNGNGNSASDSFVLGVAGNNGAEANKSGVERMLEFGRDLFQMSQRLEKEQGPNEANQKMLEVSGRVESRWWVLIGILLPCFRMHLVCWLTRIPGPVRSAGSCVPVGERMCVPPLIRLF